MKKFRSYFILILAAIVMTSCSGLNKMKKNSNSVKYEVTPKVLETHAGVVAVTIKGTFPAKYFDKKTTVTASPVLTYTGGETAFEKVQVLQGESVQANNKVVTSTGGDFTYTGTIPYKDAMKMSQLVLKIKAVRGKKSLDFDQVKLADIHYQINQADINSKELKAEDIALLKEYIKSVGTDSTRKLKSTDVSSYASPDGSMKINAPLSENRGKTADKFIKKEFNKVAVAKTEGFFNEKTTAEDWDGFKSEVEKSSIQDKDLILRVLSMYSDPEVRNKEIKNMSSAFEKLKTDILPKLRRSQLSVNVDLIGRTDDQILAQMRKDPKALGLEEMLHACLLY